MEGQVGVKIKVVFGCKDQNKLPKDGDGKISIGLCDFEESI